MDTIKGLARRTQQAWRERLTECNATLADPHVADVAQKVRVMEDRSVSICAKVVRAARLMEELGTTLREIGEEYKLMPDIALESLQLADNVLDVGMKLMDTSREHQKGLKDNGFDVLHHFSQECGRMKELEATQRHHQLEYDFFRLKVLALRQSPQKDFTRVPRNDKIMEDWRVEHWRATENYKALLSKLYLEGRQAVDRSVLTTVQVLNSFVDIASTGFKQTFYNARLPEYPTEPVLLPAPLPPSPLPPQVSQSSMGSGLGIYGHGGGPYSGETPTLLPPPSSSQHQQWSHPGDSGGAGYSQQQRAQWATHLGSAPNESPSPSMSHHTGGEQLGGSVASYPSGGVSAYQPPHVANSSNYADSQQTPYQPPPTWN